MYEILYTSDMAKIVPFSEARSNLTELLDDLEKRQEHVLITRNGRPSAVLLSAAEYEALKETLEVLQDKDLMDALKRSDKDVEAGRLTSLADLRHERG
jgi:prevent-host-death family protein